MSIFGNQTGCCNQMGSAFGSLSGDTGKQWYERAKRAVATFDALKQRWTALPSSSEKRAIKDLLGDPSKTGTWEYRYRTVKSDIIGNVERFSPLNYEAYTVERRQSRVVKLEEINVEFGALMAVAEGKAGISPIAPTILTREVTRDVPVMVATQAAPKETKPSTVMFYLAGGLAAIGAFYLFMGRK